MNTFALNPSLALPQYQYAPSEAIFCPQDVLLLCTEGIVVLSILHANGDEGLLGLTTPGLMFGLPLSCTPSAYSAVALTRVRLKAIHLAELKRSTHLGQQLTFSLMECLRRNEEFLAIANQRRVHERFTALLLMLAQRIGHKTEQGILIDVRLTHQQIANAISATRVTVTRLMVDYRNRGLIGDSHQQILIPDLEKLQQS